MTSNMMSVAGIKVDLHVPPASRSRMEGTQEVALGLPPYAPHQVYDLADFPQAPDHWVRANGLAQKSYFFGIPSNYPDGSGLWLDFRSLVEDPMEVAALISMQGVNSLTLEEFNSDTARTMQWYKDGDACPSHPDMKLRLGRFCQSCGRNWPAVNFLSTTGARVDNAALWIDGTYEGQKTVRQWWFVRGETDRGIAQNLIGERHTPGFAILLFRSVEPKSRPRESMYRDGSLGGSPRSMRGSAEVAAGARISQRIGVDPNGQDFWHPHPMGVIRVYFDWQVEIDKIFDQHKAGSGPLSNRPFPVGTI